MTLHSPSLLSIGEIKVGVLLAIKNHLHKIDGNVAVDRGTASI